MKPKFLPYDIVKIPKMPDIESAVVTDYGYRWTDVECQKSEVTYTLHIDGRDAFELPEDNLVRIGRLEQPIKFLEVVEIRPIASKLKYLEGTRGVVEGSAWNPKTKKWGYAVTLQDGVVWDFGEDEIHPIGVSFPIEEMRERYPQIYGDAEPTEADEAAFFQAPWPLKTNLNEL